MIKDLNKLCFLPGSLLPLRDGKYNYIKLLELGLSNLGVTYPTPAPSAPSLTSTYIGYGDGSNLLTGSVGLRYDISNKYFQVGFSGNDYLIVNEGGIQAGDINGNLNGNKLLIDDVNNLAYYDNPVHTGKFGINTSTPSVALDVVGDVNFASASYTNGLFHIDGDGGIVEIGAIGIVGGTSLIIDDSNDAVYVDNSFHNILFGINTSTPSVALDIVGQVKITDGILTPNCIPFIYGDNLLYGNSAGFTYNLGSGNFFVGGIINGTPATDDYAFGDISGSSNGDTIYVKSISSLAYYDNTAHDGKFGINTSTPSSALDVVGQVNISEVLKLAHISYDDLPVSPAAGMIACISNSDTLTWGDVVVPYGAATAIIFYNGTNWTVMGK